MSFKRKGPGVIISTCIGVLAGAALVGGSLALLALPALAKGSAAQVPDEIERPYAFGYGQMQTPHAITLQ